MNASMPTSVTHRAAAAVPSALVNLLPAHHAGCSGPATLVARCAAARDAVSFHWTALA
jgi:hypothetical protein